MQEPKNPKKKAIAAGVAALSLVGGSLALAAINPFAASAQDAPSTTGATGSTGAAPANGTFHSNEDPAHEAKETPEEEAAEDAGQRPEHHGGGRHGMSNEDPAHEANETPEQEAAEDARQAAGTNGSSGSSTPAPSATGSAKTSSFRRNF